MSKGAVDQTIKALPVLRRYSHADGVQIGVRAASDVASLPEPVQYAILNETTNRDEVKAKAKAKAGRPIALQISAPCHCGKYEEKDSYGKAHMTVLGLQTLGDSFPIAVWQKLKALADEDEANTKGVGQLSPSDSTTSHIGALRALSDHVRSLDRPTADPRIRALQGTSRELFGDGKAWEPSPTQRRLLKAYGATGSTSDHDAVLDELVSVGLDDLAAVTRRRVEHAQQAANAKAEAALRGEITQRDNTISSLKDEVRAEQHRAAVLKKELAAAEKRMEVMSLVVDPEDQDKGARVLLPGHPGVYVRKGAGRGESWFEVSGGRGEGFTKAETLEEAIAIRDGEAVAA